MQNIKQKQYCNKFNKDFKMVHREKKVFKKENCTNIDPSGTLHFLLVPQDHLRFCLS